jgi:hypothetical protein
MKATHILTTMFLGVTLTMTGYGLTVGAQQAPFPGAVNVNGGWVPCDHPLAINAGLGCTAKAPLTLECNPYTCPPDTPVERQVFEPGQLIYQPYPNFQAIVISVSSDGPRRIVTARITQSNGTPKVNDYVAFDSARTQWCVGACK